MSFRINYTDFKTLMDHALSEHPEMKNIVIEELHSYWAKLGEHGRELVLKECLECIVLGKKDQFISTLLKDMESASAAKNKQNGEADE